MNTTEPIQTTGEFDLETKTWNESEHSLNICVAFDDEENARSAEVLIHRHQPPFAGDCRPGITLNQTTASARYHYAKWENRTERK